MDITTKRIYAPPTPDDGTRILVDRLWPRGLTKAAAAVDHWSKSTAPSDGLRKWFRLGSGDWDEFLTRYHAELDASPGPIQELRALLSSGPATFLYASRDEEQNSAAALQAYLLGPA